MSAPGGVLITRTIETLYGGAPTLPERRGMIADLIATRAAVAQLADDVGTALKILEKDGQGDSPLAAFLRASLAKFGGAA